MRPSCFTPAASHGAAELHDRAAGCERRHGRSIGHDAVAHQHLPDGVRRLLGRRFLRRREPGDAGIAARGARELEIAELVTARKTNREIAAELFLSEKTIETHLRNTFGKLGVSSRRAVAHALEVARTQTAG